MPHKKINKAEEHLLLTRNQLEVILKNVADGITAQDATGTLIFANEIAAHAFGYKNVKEMLAAPPLDYISNLDITDEHGQPLDPSRMPGRRAIGGEKNPHILLGLKIKKTNQFRWFEAKSTALFDIQNKPYLVISTLHDITERKRVEQEKSDFLSMASHELKTPMTSLTLFLSLLKKALSTDNNTIHKYLDRIQNQVNRLVELTNDLLDVSRIETGKLRLRKERFQLEGLAADIIEELQPTILQHQIILKCQKNIFVSADKFRIEQVMTNLLTNAIKYSKKEIIVTIEIQNSYAVVSVRDFGIGINKSQQKKIFNRLYQVADEKVKTYPGLGLGLYISKEIIERHKGEIWVESEKGKGSVFSFKLPVFTK